MAELTITLSDDDLRELQLHQSADQGAGLATVEDVASWLVHSSVALLRRPDTSIPHDGRGQPLEALTILMGGDDREGLTLLGAQLELPLPDTASWCVVQVFRLLAIDYANDTSLFVEGLDRTGELGTFLERLSFQLTRGDDPPDISPEDIIRPDDE
jgi:hypothetical protein